MSMLKSKRLAKEFLLAVACILDLSNQPSTRVERKHHKKHERKPNIPM